MGFDEDGAIMRPWYILKAENDNAIRAKVEPDDLAQMVEETTFQYDGYYTLPTREFLPGEEAPSMPADAQPPWYKFLYDGGTYYGITATIYVYEEIDESAVSYSGSGSGSVAQIFPRRLAIPGKPPQLDVVPAKWEIIRNGGAKATAKPLLNDCTIGELANIIGLQAFSINEDGHVIGEFRKWLTFTSGHITVRLNSGDKSIPAGDLTWVHPLVAGQKFEIPNTMLMAWFGEIAQGGRVWMHWKRNVADLEEGLGFCVKQFNNDDVKFQNNPFKAANDFLSDLNALSIQKELHGLYMMGHGGDNEIGSSGTKVYTKGPKWSVPYITLNPNDPNDNPIGNGTDSVGGKIVYRLGKLIIHACESSNPNASLLVDQNNNHIGQDETYVPIPGVTIERIAEHWGKKRVPRRLGQWEFGKMVFLFTFGGDQGTKTFEDWALPTIKR